MASTTPGPFTCKSLTAFNITNQIVLGGTAPVASTNTITLSAATPASGNLTYTLPDAGSAASFILSAGGSQTITCTANNVLVLNTTSTAPQIQMQLGGVAKGFFGWNSTNGVTIYNGSGASILYQSASTTSASSIRTAHNILDDGSTGIMMVGGTSISPSVVNTTSCGTAALPFTSYYLGASANSAQITGTYAAPVTLTVPDPGASASFIMSAGPLQTITGPSTTNTIINFNSTHAGSDGFLKVQTGGTDRAGFGYGGSGNGIGIYDYVNGNYWLMQGGTTAWEVKTHNNTLDDGGGGASIATSGSNALNLGTGTYSGTITIGSGSATIDVAGSITPTVSSQNLGTSANPWGTLWLGNTATGIAIFGIEASLNAASVIAMNGTPVVLTGAPGIGKSIFIINAIISYNHAGSAFTSGGPIVLQYGNTAAGAGTSALNFASIPATFITAAVTQNIFAQGITGSSTPVATATTDDEGLYLSNQTGAFAGGAGSSINVKIIYAQYATTT